MGLIFFLRGGAGALTAQTRHSFYLSFSPNETSVCSGLLLGKLGCAVLHLQKWTCAQRLSAGSYFRIFFKKREERRRRNRRGTGKMDTG